MKKVFIIEMKKVFIIVVLFVVVCTPFTFAQSQQTQESILTIPEGISVPVQLQQAVSSEQDNQYVSAVVAGNVYDYDGNLLIRGGEKVTISIQSDDTGPMGVPGKINIYCHNTKAVNGQPVHLVGKYYVEGEWHRGRAIATGICLGLTVFPGFGFFFFFINGDDAEIPAGFILPDVRTTAVPIDYFPAKTSKKSKKKKNK